MLRLKNALHDHANRLLLRLRVRAPFAIISNNCWGAGFYRDLDRPYNTPFVGTLLPPDCYLRFLADVNGHLDQPLEFVAQSRYGWNVRYPIARLGDAEVHFKHYRDADEARDKWARRLDRFPRDPGLWRVKFCDHHIGADPAEGAPYLRAFDALAFPHKVCLVGRHEPALRSGILLRECLPTGRVPDGHASFRVSLRYFDAARWLNGDA